MTPPLSPPQPRSQRIGHRLPADAGALFRCWHYHGLSLVLGALFVISFAGQAWSGWLTFNEDQASHSLPQVEFVDYLQSAHFGEATFENFESEFLQMTFYVLLTVYLYQLGSSESKRPDVLEMVDLDPRRISPEQRAAAPWPVRRDGVILMLYEHSLSIAFALLFIGSFWLHAVTGAAAYTEEQLAHGQAGVGTLAFLRTSQFWFESFQNWQSEFLSLVTMVGLSIFLRQRGSPESKPVHAPTWETET